MLRVMNWEKRVDRRRDIEETKAGIPRRLRRDIRE